LINLRQNSKGYEIEPVADRKDAKQQVLARLSIMRNSLQVGMAFKNQIIII
jgi:hypothetical protein